MADNALIEINTVELWDGMVGNGKFKTVVEFYTPWCRESRMTAEVMSKMRQEFPGILFCRYNMDKTYANALTLQVDGVPTVLFLIPVPMLLKPNAGPVTQPLVVERIKGFISADMFREKLQAFMSWERT